MVGGGARWKWLRLKQAFVGAEASARRDHDHGVLRVSQAALDRQRLRHMGVSVTICRQEVPELRGLLSELTEHRQK